MGTKIFRCWDRSILGMYIFKTATPWNRIAIGELANTNNIWIVFNIVGIAFAILPGLL